MDEVFEDQQELEDNIYAEKAREEHLDDDSLSASEEAFLRGYEGALDDDEIEED